MANKSHTIEIIIKAKNMASAAIKDVGSTLDKLAGLATGGLFAFAGGALIQQVADLAMGMSDLAYQAEGVSVAFENLGGTGAEAMLSGLRDASNGMISDMDLMLSANKAMMLGVTTDATTMTRLLEVAQARGRAMGLSTAQAFDNIVTGIGRMSPLILDNLGILTGGEAAFSDYAVSIGKTAETLSDTEKRQMLVNKVVGDSTPVAEDAANGAEQLRVAWQNLRVAVSQGDVAQAVSDQLGEAAEAISRAAEANQEYETFYAELKGMLPAFNEFGNAISSLDFGTLRDRAIELRKEFKRGRISAEEYAEGLELLRDEAGITQQKNMALAFQESERQLRAYTSSMYGAIPATQQLTGAQLALAQATGMAISQQVLWQFQYSNASAAEQAGMWWDVVQSTTQGSEEYYQALMKWGDATDNARSAMESFREEQFKTAITGMTTNEQILAWGRRLEELTPGTDLYNEALSEMDTLYAQLDTDAADLATAQWQYQYTVADTAQQIDMLNAKLAELDPASTEYWDVMTQRDQALAAQAQSASGVADDLGAQAKAEAEAIKGMIESILSPTAVTEADMAATRLGVYVDKWDEYARRLESAATDVNSEWKYLIPTDILAQGQDAIRLYVDEQKRLLNTGQFDQLVANGAPADVKEQSMQAIMGQLRQKIQEEAAMEAFKAEIIARAEAEGLTVTGADLAAVTGQPALATGADTAGDFTSGVTQAITDSNLGDQLTTTFDTQLKATEERWVAFGTTTIGWFATGMKQGVNQDMITTLVTLLTPGVRDAILGRP